MFSLFLILSSWVIPIINRSLQITYFFPLFLSRVRIFILNYRYKSDMNIIFLITIIILSQINLLFANSLFVEGFRVQNCLTFTILTPLAYLISRIIKERDLKIFVYLVAFECLFVFYESAQGISTIYNNLEGYSEFESVDDLIYFNRPYGLSNNASGVAEKLLIAIMFLSLLGKKIKFSFFFHFIFFSALIINFGRTAIICVLFFFFLNLIVKFFTIDTLNKVQSIFLLMLVCIFLFIVIDFSFITELSRQFTRGTDSLDLSGRDEIWPQFINFISNNIFFGNHSIKLYFNHYGTQAQAHNSFIMVLATHGIFIFAIYLLMLFYNISKFNYKYIFTICLFSMTQYAIYWGISFMDTAFLFFLTSPVVRDLELSKDNIIHSNLTK